MYDPYSMSSLATVLMTPEAQVIIGIITAGFVLGKLLLSLVKTVPIQDTDAYNAYKDDE